MAPVSFVCVGVSISRPSFADDETECDIIQEPHGCDGRQWAAVYNMSLQLLLIVACASVQPISRMPAVGMFNLIDLTRMQLFDTLLRILR